MTEAEAFARIERLAATLEAEGVDGETIERTLIAVAVWRNAERRGLARELLDVPGVLRDTAAALEEDGTVPAMAGRA